MSYFPFTFRFTVPGLSNPFASSAPAASESGRHEHHSQAQSDTKRLKRNFDSGCEHPAPSYRRRPPPGPPSAPLVRKRGWQPSSAEPSQAAIITPSTTGIFNATPKYRDMSNAQNEGDDDKDAVLDLPPSKRRKGLTGSFISTAFNAALVGAAVGLTVFRMWKDRGKEIEQSPPPPYQEEWVRAKRTIVAPEPETPQPGLSRVQKGHATASSHKRHAGPVRHRQKVVRKTIHIKRDREMSPKKASPEVQQEHFAEHTPVAQKSVVEEDPVDEMDWIGDKLAQLIEEGKRALGKEIVVASEAPEDEVDDGDGNWVEEEPEASTSFASYSSRRVIPSSPSKRSRHAGANSVPMSASSHRPTFSLHSRFHSDDLTASLPPTPNQSTSFAFESGVGSTSFLSSTYDAESPSIRESMERARAAYLQKRGLALDRQENRY